MKLETLFEDARLLAVAKPAGTVVVPGRGEVGEPLCALAEAHAGAKVFVVHRIDRESSGLVLFAKDAEAHRLLCGQFAQRQVRKLYRALALGEVAADGEVREPLKEFGSGRIGVSPSGKAAHTVYRVVKRLRGATLLEVEPHTGRRHQIRAHLFHLGHPLLGDPLYGKERPVGGAPRLMLHAFKLEFSHPDGRRLRLDCPPGADFEAVLASLSV